MMSSRRVSTDQWWVVEFPDSSTPPVVVRAPNAVGALSKATATTSPRSVIVRYAHALEDYTREKKT